jgi:hypothetical protein
VDSVVRVESTGAADEPRKRRGVPKWLKISAVVGLALVVLLVAGGVWLVSTFNRMVDPAVQWPAIREVIAVDEPLPAYTVIGTPDMDGMEAWAISDPSGDRVAILFHLAGDRAAEAKAAMFAPESSQLSGEWFDPAVPVEAGTIVVQGRELPCLRSRYVGRKNRTEAQKDRSGPALLVDLSRGAGEFLAWMMVLEGQSGRIEDAAAIEFLKPFHVGPDR